MLCTAMALFFQKGALKYLDIKHGIDRVSEWELLSLV